jgi:fructose-1,6-bisphosphatase/inositol monophosphatase family enzyme
MALLPLIAFANSEGHNYGSQPASQVQGQVHQADNYAGALSASKAVSTAGVVNAPVINVPVSGLAGNGAGSSTQTSANNGGNVSSTIYTQPKQTPMAWSPNLAMSMSPENCSNSVSFGASAGFGAIGGGAPMDSDACNRRMDTRMWVALGQPKVACERMKQDEDNLKAMRLANINCASFSVVNVAENTVDIIPPPKMDWDMLARQRDDALARHNAPVKPFRKGKW